MKAWTLTAYGSADRLKLTECPTPEPGENQVLVRVRATSVNPYDWHHMRGEPRLARLMPGTFGLRASAITILGSDVAGQVEAVGANVTRFRPGDDVIALSFRGGGFGEYMVIDETKPAAKPASMSYEQAAAIPMAGITALASVRDTAHVEAGQTVLVTGASGGVGSFAVQIAAALGATVTGVCRAANEDMVRSIGASSVVDYQSTDYTRTGPYDLIVDIAGTRSARANRRALTPRGALVVVGGPAGRWVRPIDRVIGVMALDPFVSQRLSGVASSGFAAAPEGLAAIGQWFEEGKVAPVIDRTYGFDDLPAAVAYQEKGHARGKVVVTV
jgi:NADPH:quinone reductase-like Zn-dependent oxidoreductase